MQRYIDRFGVEATMGRGYLGMGEINRMAAIEQVITAYRAQHAAPDMEAWNKAHPDEYELLNKAMIAYYYGN